MTTISTVWVMNTANLFINLVGVKLEYRLFIGKGASKKITDCISWPPVSTILKGIVGNFQSIVNMHKKKKSFVRVY